MKSFTCVLFFLMLLCTPAQAFQLVETFDGGGAGWATTGLVVASTFTIVNDGSGKHLQAKVLRDVNDGTGRYTRVLGSTLDISDVNDSLYLEADVQVVGGFNNYGSIYLGLGRNGDNFKNQMLVRLYWDGITGNDRYSFYGAIYDSNSDTNRPPLSVTGGNQVGMAGLPYRIKAQFSNKKDIDDVNRLSYEVKVYRINADGSTGSLVGDTNAIQTTGIASLSVDQVGIFITNADLAQTTINSTVVPRFLKANIDNLYVSDTGFSTNSAIPSWYNFTISDTDIYETFTANPSGTWTTDAPPATGCSFTWKQRASDGYMDVVLTRRAVNDPYAQFYRPLGDEFLIDNGFYATEYYGIYWFVEYDAFIVDADGLSEGLIGTGSTHWGSLYNDQNIFAGAYYGAQELGDGIRATVVGYGNIYPTTRRAATVAGMLVPGKSYRIKCAAAQRYDSTVTPAGTRTRMIGSVYTINPDGTDGNLVATRGEWVAGVGDSLYADIMGIFSSMQTTTTTRSMNLYVDNMHFSTVGFKLDGVMPAWMAQPSCGELAIAGDTNADCFVDAADLEIMADNWLKVGN